MTRPELIFVNPQPIDAQLPATFPNPFDRELPHVLAERAARQLQRLLESDAFDFASASLADPRGGKMFGVLLVKAADGRIGFLCGFSGMLDGRWNIEGFVPPLFDQSARASFWPKAEAGLRALNVRHDDLAEGAERMAFCTTLSRLNERHQAEGRALRVRHEENRANRHAARQRGSQDRAALHLLDQQSRADKSERRRMELAHQQERAPIDAEVRVLDAELAALDALRAETSRRRLHQLWDTYAIENALGQTRSLSALFSPDAPPGGAGDCAAPKLLGRAYRLGLTPLGLAEFWWGAPPPDGSRRSGNFYPSCRNNCGVILPFMLEGISTGAALIYGAQKISDDEPQLLYEDEWLLVVDKPCGLLSVPGRHTQLRDSVFTRIKRRYPEATGPLIVHRLDLDTSGLLLIAKDADTHVALQRLFARREVEKRYVAWLDGQLDPSRGSTGAIELALRVDVEDRPRQIHDPVHGKSAVTDWRLIERSSTQTKVALFPRTGRTHQLRVHAAHRLGLELPIVGDRLYGRSGPRLMLHAEAVGFIHPHTRASVVLESPAPF